MSKRLADIYAQNVAAGILSDDPAQRAVLPVLEDMRTRLQSGISETSGILGRLFGRNRNTPKGLYLWGSVGRGKSMLMDLFTENLETTEKRRLHFHEFMQEIHDRLAHARERARNDAIASVAQEMARGLRLLALDEMQINDITDAMIVGRLFERLFGAGVVLITTANRPPDDLYRNGLNRELFIPFIKLLWQHMVVHELASSTDYRQNTLAGTERWLCPADQAARTTITRIWQDLTGHNAAPLTLQVKGRKVTIPAFHNGVARARFHDLCGTALGAADYLAVAEAARLLVLEDIPCLGRDNYNEARRFVTLIDALYEARTGLIASAAAKPEMLYLEGEGSFEFERTASRLHEMTRPEWGR